MAKKIYVVWKGRATGVFEDWNQCKEAIHGYRDAKYKAFKTLPMAQQALLDGYEKHYGQEAPFISDLTKEQLQLIGEPVYPSISVDAAWNTQTLVMEYQAVDTLSGEVIFHRGPFEDGTQNVGEFLAIVHALAYLKKERSDIPIYSDSRNAIGWVKDKTHRSGLAPSEKNSKLFEMLDRAVKWLEDNNYNNPVLKWETKAWGENPADFGRK